MANIYVGQELQVTVTTGVDLTNDAGATQVLIRKPDGTESTEAATIVGPAIDGVLGYTFVVGELDQAGDWSVKSFLTNSQTPGEVYVFSVLALWDRAGIPSVAEIREYLEGYCITEEKLSSAWVARTRDAVTGWVSAKIRQPITESKQYTEYISGTGRPIIWVSRRPIISVDEIAYVTSPGDFQPSLFSTEIVHEEGVIRARYALDLQRWPVFQRGTYNIRVTYTAGMVTVPTGVREAILALTCEKMLGHIANRLGGGSSISVNGFSQNYGERGKYTEARNDLSRWAMSLLRDYLTGVISS